MTIILLSIFGLVSAYTVTAQQTVSVYFDDTAADVMRLGNNFYEIGIRKTNGAIAYIIDKTTGQYISEGSRNECLWGVLLQQNEYIGGCAYRFDNNARKFSYNWNGGAQRLTLTYIATPPQYPEVNAWVDITPSTSHRFDMHLFLQNKSGKVAEQVLFPSDMVFLKDYIQSGLFPAIPGILLQPSFFSTFLPQKNDHQYVVKYPSWPGIFADYLALVSTKGKFTMYSIPKPDDPLPIWMGFVYDSASSPYRADSVYIYHTINAMVANGDIWTSPAVRLHIGEDYRTTIQAYRQDIGLAAFSPLREKLGEVYTQTVRSPIIKVDTDKPMDYYRNTISEIPSPAILHWVSYWIPSFDENYPDFLPPKEGWGTTAELASLFNQAKSYDLLNMPYTNPTWWDDESPTLQGQPIADIAMMDRDDNLRYECYTGSTNPPSCTPENARRDSAFNRNLPAYLWLHGGYAVSPYAPFVQNRLAQLMTDMTTTIPSDFVFEDQVGTGDRGNDYNPHAPAVTSYLRGWLAHTQTYSNNLLMTETGYDLLARSEAGFNGSYLLLERKGNEPAQWWGDNNWQIYPFVGMVARDKTLFYQHNLAPETFTVDKKIFLWNLAMGFMFSYDLNPSPYGGGLDSPWLQIVHVFQKEVLAEYADELVTDYTWLQPDVSQTIFPSFAVTVNWSQTQPYNIGNYMLPPEGVYISNYNGQVIAGIFTEYNGASLSNGEHFIIEKRDRTGIRVWQPSGNDTDIKLTAIPSWSNGDTVLVSVYDHRGRRMALMFATVESNAINLPYQTTINGNTTAYYRLTGPVVRSDIYLPLIIK